MIFKSYQTNKIEKAYCPCRSWLHLLRQGSEQRVYVVAYHMTRLFHSPLPYIAIVMAVGACSPIKPVTNGAASEEQRRIAEACLRMLHSSLTNEVDILVDDPRVPAIIRALQPLAIEIRGQML